MENTKNGTQSGGIGLSGLVFAIFLVLKLIGHEPVTSWSWWWVTAPIWGPTSILIGIAIIATAFAGVCRD
jgi:hypothetical protein